MEHMGGDLSHEQAVLNLPEGWQFQEYLISCNKSQWKRKKSDWEEMPRQSAHILTTSMV